MHQKGYFQSTERIKQSAKQFDETLWSVVGQGVREMLNMHAIIQQGIWNTP